MTILQNKLVRENLVSMLSFIVAVILTGIVIFVLPPDREVKSLGIFLFKLLPFIFASVAIATIQREMLLKYDFQYLIIIGSFLVFFCYLVPKIIFHRREFEELYYVLLITTPYIILALTLAYRIGGASSEKTIRLAIALLLLMISGIEDLAFFTVNYDPTWPPLPEVWDWVSHITVRLGHPPTRNEIIVFASAHIILALMVLYLPFGKIVQRVKSRRFASSLETGGV